MKTRVQLRRERKQIQELAGLIEVYEESAATKLRAIKNQIVEARDYFEGLHATMLAVGADIPRLGERGQKKRALLWLSSQKGLFGEIVEKTRQVVAKQVADDPEMVVYIAGTRGQTLWNEWRLGKEVNMIDLVDEAMTEVQVSRLIGELPNYQELVVVYGRFVNLLTQEPVAQSLLANIPERDPTVSSQFRKTYLYEPDYLQVADVFGDEIARSILTQMEGESRLSKYASRMMHLETTMDKVNKDDLRMKRELRRAESRASEHKQQARLTQMYARRTG